MQAKLLRVIEQQEFRRLGARENRRSTFRVVVAVSDNLDALIAANRLRRDLVYRIAAVTISLLPLRQRPSDISLLADHFLAAATEPGQAKTFSEAARILLSRHLWPGNVRELKTVIERIREESEGDVVTPADVMGQLRFKAGWTTQLGDALSANDWDIAKTARMLGVARSTVYERMKKLGIVRLNEPAPDESAD
jgi:DNA-binding NtrC family response regulator